MHSMHNYFVILLKNPGGFLCHSEKSEFVCHHILQILRRLCH